MDTSKLFLNPKHIVIKYRALVSTGKFLEQAELWSNVSISLDVKEHIYTELSSRL